MRANIMKAMLATSMLTSALLVATPALAQSSDEASDGDGDIVVTGVRKRAEDVQSVPITITALSEEDLAERNITSLAALGNSVPGVAVNSIAGGNVQTIYFRGLGPANTTNDLNVEANVGVFIDGIYQTSRNTLDILSVLDIGQIDVAKGPQSALYGRSTFAGALGISTGRPSRTLTGGVTATLGTDEDYRLRGFVSGPLSDTLGFRIAGGYSSFDGFAENAADTSDNLNGSQKYAFSGALEFRPSDNFRATLSGFVTHSETELSAVAIIPLNLLNCGVGNTLYCGTLPAPGTVSVTPNLHDTVSKNMQISLELEARLDGVRITSVSGMTRSTNFGFSDYDGSAAGTTFGVCTLGSACLAFVPFAGAPVPYTRLTQVNLATGNRERVNSYSQEIRLQSDNDSPFQWILGGNYFRSRVPLLATGIGASPSSPLTANERLVAVTQFATPAATGTGGYDFTANPFLVADSAATQVFGSYSSSGTDNFGIFASASYELGQFRLTAEGRYNVERKRARTFSVSNPLSAPGVNQPIAGTTVPAAGVFPVVSAPFARTFSSFSPRITLDYRPMEDVLLYVSAAKGVRSGGFNTVNPVSATGILASEVAYEEETNWTYEAGIKSRLFDRALLFNAAFFHVDWSNAQVSGFTANPTAVNPSRIVQNTGSLSVNGVEVQAEWSIGDMFALGGSVTYSDPQFDAGAYDGSTTAQCRVGGNVSTATSAPGCPPIIPVVVGNGTTQYVISLEGNRPQRSVKLSWNAYVTADVPVNDNWNLSARVDVNHTGNAYANLINTAAFGERTLTNVRLALESEQYSVALWATNLFDKSYVANSINQPRAGFPFTYSLNEIYLGESRRIGLTASVRF